MKTKILALALALVLLLTACASQPAETTASPTTAPIETTQPFDLDAYKADVRASVDRIRDGATIMEYAAYTEAIYLETRLSISASVSSDGLWEYARDQIKEETGLTQHDITKLFDSISEEYKAIILSPISGAEAEEIDRLYRGLYIAYTELHQLAMNPPTDLDDLTAKREEICNIIDSNAQQLELFV